MTRLWRFLVAGFVLLLARRRPRPGGPRIVAAREPSLRAETAVLLALGGATIAAAAFLVVYALDRLSHQTQFLGLALGSAFALLAVASIVVAKAILPDEEIEHDYSELHHLQEESEIVQIVDEAGDSFSRRGLLKLAAGGAGTALGLALVTPAISLGPALHTKELNRSPWRPGRRLVDDGGKPYRADEIEVDAFYTAYPEHAPREDVAAPLVLLRLDPARLDLPPERDGWAPRGIVAYSKTCTHAGCAVSEYRAPLFEQTSAKPALVCPCHYSTFDPATGGTVLVGPAGRPLPQLPLAIDGDGNLRADGAFSSSPGPSWPGVRR